MNQEVFMPTKKVRVLIADDEPNSLETMNLMLGEIRNAEIVAQCSTGLQAVKAINKHAPDIAFLDIQMPDLDGFGVVEKIARDRMPIIVFVTAYNRFAVQAFEAQALDYILKPYDHDRIHAAFERARRSLTLRKNRESTAVALQEHKRADGSPQRILVKKNGRIFILRAQDLDWIEAAADYVRLHVKEEAYLLHEKLGSLESKLDQRTFVRIHRSAIVNIDRVKELEPLFHRDYLVLLRDGQELTLSRTFANNFFDILKKTA